MPNYEEFSLIQTKTYSPQELNLLTNEKSPGITQMLSEAYEWGKEHKLAIGLAAGAVAITALGMRAAATTRANMAEMYSPPVRLGTLEIPTLGVKVQIPTNLTLTPDGRSVLPNRVDIMRY